jgi:hypothetical protein
MPRHNFAVLLLACFRFTAGHGGGQHYHIDGEVYTGFVTG